MTPMCNRGWLLDVAPRMTVAILARQTHWQIRPRRGTLYAYILPSRALKNYKEVRQAGKYKVFNV